MGALDHAVSGVRGFPRFPPTRQRLTKNYKHDSDAGKDKQEAQKLSHTGISVREGSVECSGL